MIWIIIGAIAWGIAGIIMFRILTAIDQVFGHLEGEILMLLLIACLIGWPVMIILRGLSALSDFIANWKR